jgi:hypothetical protein
MTPAPAERGHDVGADLKMTSSTVQIGPLSVTANAAEALAFAQATPQVAQSGTSDELPFTFPLRWLTRDEIRNAVATLMPHETGRTFLLLHESQSFDYAAALYPGVDYRMMVEIRSELQTAQIVVNSAISADDNVVHLRMDMVLRLVAADHVAPADAAELGL